MLKILVVDDETPIRQWFVFCIEKSGKGYEVVGEASNGQQALEIFKEKKPDVVIMDIKMPVMDGLELMKRVKELEPSTDIVILTCYADFEFARQAVKEGVAEYMLKTEVSDREMLDILQRVEKRRLEQGNAKKVEQDQLQLQRNAAVKELMRFRNEDTGALKEILDHNNIVLHRYNLFAMAVKFNSGMQRDLNSMGELLDPEMIDTSYFFCHDDGILIILGNMHGVPSQLIQINNLLKVAGTICRKAGASVGLGHIYHEVGSLPGMAREAVWALGQQFFKEEPGVCLWAGSAGSEEDRTGIEKIKNAFLLAVDNSDINAVLKHADSLMKEFEKGLVLDTGYIYRVCIRMLEAIQYQCGKEVDMAHISAQVKENTSFRELKNWVLLSVRELAEVLECGKGKYSEAINKALDYINANYEKAVSLAEVAAVVHLNPEYFSRLFKEDTGENFSVYIMTYRLKKAEELFKTTDMKMYEVAERVGYPNLSYFSRIYKKYMGKSI